MLCSIRGDQTPFWAVVKAFEGSFTMTSASSAAKSFRVRIKERGGMFIATSPDIRGLVVAEHSLAELDATIPSAVQDLFAACGVQVVVTKLEEEGHDGVPWVAFPAEVARQGLQRVASSEAA